MSATRGVDQPPLAGVRVVECGLAFAGPVASRFLAALGAEVVKIDSRSATSFAIAPSWAPAALGPAALDLAAGAAALDGGKRSLGLNLKTEEGRMLLGKLIARSDIFVTNFSVPAIESLRLRHADVVEWNPNIIYAGMSGFGTAAGPYRDYRSFGPTLSALAGYDFLTGDADRDPVMTQAPYLDYLAAYHAVTAILFALLERDLTGHGREVQVSQFAVAVSALGPVILQEQLTSAATRRTGNRHPAWAPRGVFPCLGKDRWVAIEVRDDLEWRNLLSVPSMPAVLREHRFAEGERRLAQQDEIEAALTSWTRAQTSRGAAYSLQSAGVAACPVQTGLDHVSDPHLEARQFWRIVYHDRLGSDLAPGFPIGLSRTPLHYQRAAPSLGHDTDEVLTGALGCSRAEVERLLSDGVAEREAPTPPELTGVVLERPWTKWAWPLLGLTGRRAEPPPAAAEDDRCREERRPGASDVSACRVLDLSDELSAYGTKLLASLGAQVTRVRGPDGRPLGWRPGSASGSSTFERWVDAGKHTVTLNLDAQEGRAELARLAAAADILYESLPVGRLASQGLGYEELAAANPRLVLVSVTPFGQTGPYAHWRASELGLWALSGALASTGYPDRRPVTPPPVAAALVGTVGAVAALAALRARSRTGLGQWADVSAHETLLGTTNTMLAELESFTPRPRMGSQGTGVAPWGYYACSDRMVSLTAISRRHWHVVASWIAEETGDASGLAEELTSPVARFRSRELIDPLINRLAGRYDADAFCAEAQRRGLAAMPLNSIADLLVDKHLEATGFWAPATDGAAVRWPGPPFTLHGGPAP